MARLRPRLTAALALVLAGVVGTDAREAAAAVAPESEQGTPRCPRQQCGTIAGRARVASERQPVPGASILVVPAAPDARKTKSRAASAPPPSAPAWSVSATADSDGNFVVEDVPTGRVRILVVAAGFVVTDRIIEIDPDETTEADLYVQPDEDNPYRTVVRSAAAEPREPRRHVLSREEIETMPGSQGDPLRGLQNLPGVARSPASLGLLVLRGAPPSQSGVFLGGHAIPRAFHVLSLSSIFPADVIDQLDFVPGNFDPAYGNATAGVVVVEPRAGRRDGVHGHGEIDFAAASALVEGPVGDGSFVVGVQRGYVDAVLAGTGAVVERVTGDPNNFLLPSYWDYQGMVDQPLPGGAKFSLRVLGAGDRLRGSSDSDTQSSNAGFDFRSDFHRVDLVFRKRTRRFAFLLTPSLRYQYGLLALSNDTLKRRRDDGVLSLRMQGTARVTSAFDLTLGADSEIDVFRTLDDAAIIDPDTFQSASRLETRERGVETSTGAFMVADLHRGRFGIRPGIRANAFTVLDQVAHAVDPRLSARVRLGERWKATAGIGQYSQVRPITDANSVDLINQTSGVAGGNALLPPVFNRFDPQIEFAAQDTSLTVRTATQASIGADLSLDAGWGLGATGYFRDQSNAEPLLFEGEPVSFSTRSRNLGLEVLIRKRITKKVYGWIAYTLSYGELRFVEGPDDLAGRRRPSDFDQRHNLIALASYRLPRGWRIGGRFRLVSGYPFTPIVGSIAVRGGYIPVRGGRNEGRLPPFHQLDLRVDREWVLQRVKVNAYVDIQNVYNRQNPEAILYASDFRSEAGFVGIPIYPTIGVRIEY